MSPQVLTPFHAAHPAALRRLTAGALRLASHALDRLAQRVAVPHAPSKASPPAQLEFHSEAGAPEGALYADGVLVAVLPGVTRL
jgi:hypothetical protein